PFQADANVASIPRDQLSPYLTAPAGTAIAVPDATIADPSVPGGLSSEVPPPVTSDASALSALDSVESSALSPAVPVDPAALADPGPSPQVNPGVSDPAASQPSAPVDQGPTTPIQAAAEDATIQQSAAAQNTVNSVLAVNTASPNFASALDTFFS